MAHLCTASQQVLRLLALIFLVAGWTFLQLVTRWYSLEMCLWWQRVSWQVPRVRQLRLCTPIMALPAVGMNTDPVVGLGPAANCNLSSSLWAESAMGIVLVVIKIRLYWNSPLFSLISYHHHYVWFGNPEIIAVILKRKLLYLNCHKLFSAPFPQDMWDLFYQDLVELDQWKQRYVFEK